MGVLHSHYGCTVPRKLNQCLVFEKRRARMLLKFSSKTLCNLQILVHKQASSLDNLLGRILYYKHPRRQTSGKACWGSSAEENWNGARRRGTGGGLVSQHEKASPESSSLSIARPTCCTPEKTGKTRGLPGGSAAPHSEVFPGVFRVVPAPPPPQAPWRC